MELISHALITIAALFVALLVAYFKKRGELQAIDDQYEKILSQQRRLTEQNEKIKQLLDQESIYLQGQVQAYFKHSVDSITEIYYALINIRRVASDVALQVSTDEELRKSLIDAAQNFLDTYQRRRIWIPKDVCAHIEGVAKEIDTQCHKFLFTLRQQERIASLSEKQIAALSARQERFYDFFNQEIQVLFEGVIDQISNTIQPQISNKGFNSDAGRAGAG